MEATGNAAPQPYLGLWLFLPELCCPSSVPRPVLGGHCNRSLLAHACLAGMQHHFKEQGQLL